MRQVLGIAVLGAMVGCNGKASDRVDTILALTGDAVNGATVYGANCALCHGPDGAGDVTYPPIPGTTTSEDGLAQRILDGGETMPAYDTLSDQAIADCIAYILTF